MCVSGKVLLQCLHGNCSVLGYDLKPDGLYHPLYSPDTNSLLTVTPTDMLHGAEIPILRDKLNLAGVQEDIVDRVMNGLNNKSVVLLLKRLNSRMCDFVKTVPPFESIWSAASGEWGEGSLVHAKAAGVHVATRGHYKTVRITSEQRHVAQPLRELVQAGRKPLALLRINASNCFICHQIKIFLTTSLNLVLCFIQKF